MNHLKAELKGWQILQHHYALEYCDEYTWTGLCRAIERLSAHSQITPETHTAMSLRLDKHKPKRADPFAFWWDVGSLAPRLKVIKKIIREIEIRLRKS